jgi:hypothetical protein
MCVPSPFPRAVPPSLCAWCRVRRARGVAVVVHVASPSSCAGCHVRRARALTFAVRRPSLTGQDHGTEVSEYGARPSCRAQKDGLVRTWNRSEGHLLSRGRRRMDQSEHRKERARGRGHSRPGEGKGRGQSEHGKKASE